jgi:hypothetical protein
MNSACECVKIFTGKTVMMQDKNYRLVMLHARFKAAGPYKMTLSDGISNYN